MMIFTKDKPVPGDTWQFKTDSRVTAKIIAVDKGIVHYDLTYPDVYGGVHSLPTVWRHLRDFLKDFEKVDVAS